MSEPNEIPNEPSEEPSEEPSYFNEDTTDAIRYALENMRPGRVIRQTPEEEGPFPHGAGEPRSGGIYRLTGLPRLPRSSIDADGRFHYQLGSLAHSALERIYGWSPGQQYWNERSINEAIRDLNLTDEQLSNLSVEQISAFLRSYDQVTMGVRLEMLERFLNYRRTRLRALAPPRREAIELLERPEIEGIPDLIREASREMIERRADRPASRRVAEILGEHDIDLLPFSSETPEVQQEIEGTPEPDLDCEECEYGIRTWSKMEDCYLSCSLCGYDPEGDEAAEEEIEDEEDID